MLIMHDDGSQHSDSSWEYFQKAKQHLGKVRKIFIDDERTFSMEIVGDHVILLLSGTGAGYPGTAPTLSETILKGLGVPTTVAEMVRHDNRHIAFELKEASLKAS